MSEADDRSDWVDAYLAYYDQPATPPPPHHWLRVVAMQVYEYVFRIVYHAPISASVIGVGCMWGHHYLEGMLIFAGTALAIIAGTWFMTKRAPERRQRYITGGLTRGAQCIGVALISFVRAPVSYYLVGTPEPWRSDVEKIALAVLAAGFLIHWWFVWRSPNKPLWIRDLLYGQRRS